METNPPEAQIIAGLVVIATLIILYNFIKVARDGKFNNRNRVSSARNQRDLNERSYKK